MSNPTAREALEAAHAALVRAQQFIRNGRALGFIRMPDADTPDTAHETPTIIDSAIAAARAALTQEPAEPAAPCEMPDTHINDLADEILRTDYRSVAGHVARKFARAVIAARDAQWLAAPPVQPVAPEGLRKLAAFGAAMLYAHRGSHASEVGDIDGGTAQDEAIACGVLEARIVTGPCGEECMCSAGDECYSVPDDVRAARAMLAAAPQAQAAQEDGS